MDSNEDVIEYFKSDFDYLDFEKIFLVLEELVLVFFEKELEGGVLLEKSILVDFEILLKDFVVKVGGSF